MNESVIHCVSEKRPTWYCSYLCQILTDFQNSCTGTLAGKLALEICEYITTP